MHRTLEAALGRAVALAARGPLAGGNPRVGCVIVDDAGQVLGEGWHRGAGTPHAEVAALADARPCDLRRATAVVTLEPCNHTGRTGACSHALQAAGVPRVVYAVPDPDPRAAGGAAWLTQHGVKVRTAAEAGVSAAACAAAEELVHPWLTAVRRRRPWVIGKTATTLDGRVAATDGSSRWITGTEARAHAHRVRGEVDAVMIGTGTVIADDPALTVRDPAGEDTGRQPLRVVIGTRPVPREARLRGRPGAWVHLPTHDLAAALRELFDRGVRRALLEGGPTLLTAALAEDLVDELHTYIAPALLGAGTTAVGDLGIRTVGEAMRWRPDRPLLLGQDLFLAARQDPGPQRDRVQHTRTHHGLSAVPALATDAAGGH